MKKKMLKQPVNWGELAFFFSRQMREAPRASPFSSEPQGRCQLEPTQSTDKRNLKAQTWDPRGGALPYQHCPLPEPVLSHLRLVLNSPPHETWPGGLLQSTHVPQSLNQVFQRGWSLPGAHSSIRWAGAPLLSEAAQWVEFGMWMLASSTPEMAGHEEGGS